MASLHMAVSSAFACMALAAAFAAPGRHVAYRSFNKEPEATARFAGMGYATRCFFAANTLNGCCQPYCEYPPMWKGDETYDFSPFDAQVDDLLKASPGADFICIVDLNSPAWFTRRYGIVDDSFSNMTHVLFNPLWRDLTGKWMKAFLAHAEKRLAGRVKGYVLAGGCTCEWYENDYGRSSRAKNAEWRKWCARRGVRHGDATPSEAELPKAAFENALYDPATEADKIDYWRFHNSIAADAILHFASEARKALPEGREIGVFFGYYNVVEGTQLSLGHLDYLRVFDSPDIDFIVAPGLYAGRGCGGGSGSLAMFADAHLRGKRLLHEIDFWPSTKPSRFGRYFKTVADDVAGNTREAAFALVNGASWWWFDMWGGFYTTRPLLERIAALREIELRHHDDGPGSAADVLLVADPESVFFTNEKDAKTYGFGQCLYRAVAKSGAAFDNYSWDSLSRLDLGRYKVVMLPAMLLMTPERERFLKERVLRDGRTVVWVYAPGITDGHTLDKSRVEKWAGVPFGTEGVSTTKRDGWISVYAYDYRLLTPEALYGIFANAGAHMYTDGPAVVFAGERLLAVHVKDGGEKSVRLPRRAKRVTDLFSGKTVCEAADAFRHWFASPDTALFEVEWERTEGRACTTGK